MIHVPLPVLYTENFSYPNTDRRIHPIKLSINENMVPLSTATLVMPRSEPLSTKYMLRLFTPNGESGFYRVRSPEIDYRNDTITYRLDHMAAEIGDWCTLAKYTGNYSATNAIKRIWRGADASSTSDDNYRGNYWQLGDTTALTGNTVEMSAENRGNVLSALLDVLDGCPGVYMTFDFRPGYSFYPPWTINFAKVDSSSEVAHGRLTRNIESAKVVFDDTEICTRVRYYYSSWHYYTADSQYTSEYGIVERKLDTTGCDSLEQAQYQAKEYLRKNQEPKKSISISGQDLSAITGESVDRFAIGKLFSLYVSELKTEASLPITGLNWNDVYGNPLDVDVTLGDEDPTLWAYLKKIKKK